MTAPFRRRTVVWLTAAAGASFVLGLMLIVFQHELQDVRSTGPNTFSSSALGHGGWIEVLRRLGRPVVVSRGGAGARTDPDALLVVAEPDVGTDEDLARFQSRVSASARTLVVLPKWNGRTDATLPSWVASVTPVPERTVQRILHGLSLDAEIVRRERRSEPTQWSSELGPAPEVQFAQLLLCEDLEPVIASADGVMLGRRRTDGRELLVLTVPDVIANHGLLRGGNAELAVAMTQSAEQRNGVVVFDETLHGFAVVRSLYREMFGFPPVLAVAQALVALVALLWAGMIRFGSPRPVASELGTGRRTLIENTADLLAFGGHAGHSLDRYFRRALETVVRERPTPGGSELDVVESARRAGSRAGARETVDDLAEDVRVFAGAAAGTQHRAVGIAARIHGWRQEVLDGVRRDTTDR